MSREGGRTVKVYIATSLSNQNMHNMVRDLIEDMCTLTYDWTVHGSVKEQGLEALGDVSIDEINGVLAADLVIVLLPGGRGTHAELGAAIAANKIVFLFAPDEVMEPTPATCAFYHHPIVKHFSSMLHLIKEITKMAVTT